MLTTKIMNEDHIQHAVRHASDDRSGQNIPMHPNEAKAKALIAIFDAIVDSIKAAGDHGAPGGILYAALMAQGCTLNQFHMGTLINAGRIEMRGQCYHITQTLA